MATRISTREWKQLAVESDYGTQKLAKLLGLSLRQVERIIRRQFDTTPRTWLAETRLVEAGKLLRQGNKVMQVASDLRYKQASHFCRQFKEFHGVRPAQFISTKRKSRNVAYR